MEPENPSPSKKFVMPVWLSIPLYIAAVFLMMLPLGVLYLPFTLLPSVDSIYYELASNLVERGVLLISVVVCAIFFIKILNKRPVSDLGLSIKGRGKECLAGMGVAAVIYLVGFGITWWVGAVEVVAVKWDWVSLVGSFLIFLVAAAAEEVMMRGYVQGVLMRTGLHRWAALAIASALFSLIHLFNPNLSFFALLNLFLAGTMLGASFLYTRNLWFPIVLHTAWNWIQGSVLGYEVSGVKFFPSLFTLNLSEENLMNGGSFGFEGSVVCTVLLILCTVLIIAYYEKRK